MKKVVYLGPQESYGFRWRDGVEYKFERDAPTEVPDDVAEYVLTQLNPEKFPLGREAHDAGRQVFMGEVLGKAGRKALSLGGDS